MKFYHPRNLAVTGLAFLFLARGCLALTPHQVQMVKFAYRIGGQTEVSIIEDESSVCRNKLGDYRQFRDGRWHPTAFGCGQLHCRAVRELTGWKRCPISRLIYDDRFNIVLSVAYFDFCLHETGTWRRALVCYNSGAAYGRRISRRGLRHNAYVRRIVRIQRGLNDFRSLYIPAPHVVSRLRDH